MKRINALFCLSIFGLALTSCGGDAPVEDPAHEHQWGVPTYSWASDYSSCTAQRVCVLVSSHVEKETVSSVITDRKSPTETEDGFIEYTATFTNEVFLTQIHKEVVYATGHEHTYSDTWSFDEAYHWHAANCGHNEIKDKAEHTFVDTLGEDGALIHTCSVCEYSYKEGRDPEMLKYQDNTSIPEELNAALKSILINDNFTLEKSTSFENATGPAPYVHVIGGMPGKEEEIAKLQEMYEQGKITEEEYLKYLQNILDMYETMESKFTLTVNGVMTRYIKIDNLESELGFVLTGEVTASLAEVLQSYNKSSLQDLINDASTFNHFKQDALSGLSHIDPHLGSFDIENITASGDKIKIIENGQNLISEFYDSELGQFYFKTNNVPMGYIYVSPAVSYFSSFDTMYSALEQYRYFAHELTESSIEYDSETHTYSKSYIGSGGGILYSIFDLFPMVIDKGQVSAAGYTLKNIGTTVISTDKTISSCSHPSGTTIAWYDENFHADYCKDCGRMVSKHSHDCDNEHAYCTTCLSFKNPKALVECKPEYAGKVIGISSKVEINTETQKKYVDYPVYSTGLATDSFTGTDGRVYQYFAQSPTNGNKADYWAVAATHGEGAEDVYIAEDSCVQIEKLFIYKQVVNRTYLRLERDVIPAEMAGHISDPNKYYNVTEEVVSSLEIIDTVYSYPKQVHSDLTFSTYRVLTLQQAMAEIPAIYSRVESYVMAGYQLDNAEQYSIIVTNCERCGEVAYACIAAPQGDILFGPYVYVNDNNAHTKMISVVYDWGGNFESCTASMYLQDLNTGAKTLLSSEEATVEINSEDSVIVASFTKPEFKTQLQPYYAE